VPPPCFIPTSFGVSPIPIGLTPKETLLKPLLHIFKLNPEPV
jgi:hypothetical protein